MAVTHLSLQAVILLVLATCSWAQYEYDYGYGDDFYEQEEGAAGDSYYDEYGYYGDEDDAYYEYYGYYADDTAGYEDYYSDEYDSFEECSTSVSGKPALANGSAVCDIKISGVNKLADKLTGGLDGIYKLTSCYNGKALYLRAASPAGEGRVLWYSSTFGDWDVSKGTEPNEAEILMYGGEMEHASVPLFVTSWHLGAGLKSDTTLGEDDYMPIKVKVSCSDGTIYAADEVRTNTAKTGPVLTDDEMEAKYRAIYDKHNNTEPSPTINFTFVVLLVMAGLTVVLAMPYFLLKKKGKQSMSGSFSQILQSSKKKQAGHMN